MQTQELSTYSRIIDEIAKQIDITEEMYLKAEKQYNELGHYLEKSLKSSVSIYPQGSFMLGTVIKPYKNCKDADYDIDLVCEFSNKSESSILPEILKKNVGNVLQNSEEYQHYLDKEGKRCWTLNFTGFHMDCLPCVPLTSYDEKISLTHTEDFKNYKWMRSNPKELGEWFKQRQAVIYKEIKIAQKQRIYESNRRVYDSVDAVPDRRVKTPLQKAVQILKRHRDVYFANKTNEKYKPISMVITVLAAELYEQEADSYFALKNIVEEMGKYEELFKSSIHRCSAKKEELIKFDGNKWRISNPVAQEENFAERWHEDNHARAKAFFEWVSDLKHNFLQELESQDLKVIQKCLGQRLCWNIREEKLISLGFSSNTGSYSEPLPPIREVVITNPIKPYLQY